MLEVKNISKIYDFKEHFNEDVKKLTILDDINFTLQSSENLSILGISGSGKSTLARIICGLENPTKGNIYLDNVPLDLGHFKDFKKISSVMQNQKSCLNPALKIKTTLKLLEKYQNTKFLQTEIDTLFKNLNLNTNMLNKFPYELSGGEASRIGILKSLLLKPEILILDEITSGLDDENKQKLLDLLTNIKTSIIFITHDIKAAKVISKNLLIIEQGKVVLNGKFEELKNNHILQKYNELYI